jgi:hypothetical protein
MFTLPLGDILYWAGSILLMVLYSPVGFVLVLGTVILLGLKKLQA